MNDRTPSNKAKEMRLFRLKRKLLYLLENEKNLSIEDIANLVIPLLPPTISYRLVEFKKEIENYFSQYGIILHTPVDIQRIDFNKKPNGYYFEYKEQIDNSTSNDKKEVNVNEFLKELDKTKKIDKKVDKKVASDLAYKALEAIYHADMAAIAVMDNDIDETIDHCFIAKEIFEYLKVKSKYLDSITEGGEESSNSVTDKEIDIISTFIINRVENLEITFSNVIGKIQKEMKQNDKSKLKFLPDDTGIDLKHKFCRKTINDNIWSSKQLKKFIAKLKRCDKKIFEKNI